MGRWAPDARRRLEQAALGLFTEQGFAATTVPQIAARAGLTTRTFFRHFADKREVLFAGNEIPRFAARVMAEAPASLEPAALIVRGLRTVTEARFEGRRDELRKWRRIIRSDEGLRERDLLKRAALVDVVRAGFVARGIDPMDAALLGETTITVLTVALDRWLDEDGERTLHAVVLETMGRVTEVVAPFAAASGGTQASHPVGR